MKILNLRFKNINSLAGTHEINFKEDAFSREGIFAITGKTGAGKSSILDAISLALYGKTPRVDISANENAVMTRGEKDCFAEVSFETGQGAWISAWKQEKTKTGNLKPVQRTIANLDGQIIADQVRTCSEKIVELVGLNFEQFTKVILLAQGSFAAFLQADKNDKGALLEQITGTEIYGEISKKVFERNKLEKEKLDHILLVFDTIKLLSEDEILNITKEKEALVQQKNTIEQEFSSKVQSKNWLIELQQLQEQLRLAKASLPEQNQQLQEAEALLNQSKIKLAHAKEALVLQEPIFKAVRDLDTKINLKEQELNPIIQKKNVLDNQLKNEAQKLKDFQILLDKNGIILTQEQDWHQQHQYLATLAGQYAAIEQTYALVQKQNQEIKQLTNEYEGVLQSYESKKVQEVQSKEKLDLIEKNLLDLTQALEEKNAAFNQIVGDKPLSEWQADKATVTTFGMELKALIEQEKLVLNLVKEQQEAKDKIQTYQNTQLELQHTIKEKNERIALLQENIKVGEQNVLLNNALKSLESHRQHLKDGEACPLCGALEHPYALGNLPMLDDQELAVSTSKNELAKLESERNQVQIKLAEIGSDQNQLEKFLEKSSQQLQDCDKKIQEHLSHLRGIENNFNIPVEQHKISWLQDLLSHKQSEYKTIDQTISLALSAELALKEMRDLKLPNLTKEKYTLEQIYLENNKQLELVKQDLTNRQEHIKLLEYKLKEDQSLLSNHLKQYQANDLVELKKQLETWQKNQLQIESLGKQMLVWTHDMRVIENTINGQTKNLNEITLEENKINKEKQTLETQRVALFGDKKVDAEENQLKDSIAEAEAGLVKADQTYQTIKIIIEKTMAVINDKEKEFANKQALQLTNQPLETLESELLESKQKLDEIILKLGAIQQTLKSNEENKLQLGAKQIEKENQQKEYERWSILSELIGSSDGKKYRNFAQALTFEQLILLANSQLKKMSDRYQLIRSKDASNPFDLSVVDLYQNNESRTAQNLSGGEKFIVSLSLALGLANMAGKNVRIDTMFIDEGFGTLDSDYLDVALSALSSLQSEGKMIGVISHLSELKERIATHIEVLPKGNGHSTIRVVA
jgi:DNA repair protein SbcC/Rad50